MTKIEEIEQKLNECQKALAELKESKKEGKWKPKDDEVYWFRDADGFPDWTRWCGSAADIWRYNNISIFPTKPEYDKYWHFMDTVKEKSCEFSEEEWKEPGIAKHYIYYSFESECFNINATHTSRYLGEIYFKKESDAQYIIDNFKDELLKYWL